MFNEALPFFIYLVNSIAGSIYAHKFHKGKYPGRFVLLAWMCLYFMAQSLVLERLSSIYPIQDLVKAVADIAFVLLLQMLFYNKDLLRQLFVAVSFVAGKEIIKYIIVVVNYGQYWVSDKILAAFSANITTMKKVNMWSLASNGIIWFITLLLYAMLMIVYFSIISRKFVRKGCRLKAHGYTFLILPSVASLCISITLKILIFTVENGMTQFMFDKVPETMFWVPFICLLLLCVNISSVILFQKLVQLGEEEQKRAMLESQMMQMQQEIEEIQDIYADMRGLRHDMNSHLESIAAVIRRTSGRDREELDGYIGKMEATVSRLDFAYMTGNPITDVILHQKKQEADRRGILLEADFTYPDKRQFNVYDIGIVLNNALANAIEASSKLEVKKRIRLCSYMKGNLFFIEVENDFLGELALNHETGLPISSKEDKQLHGIGMENIQRCAKKYMGDIDITIHDMKDRKKFILTVMMYEKYTL